MRREILDNHFRKLQQLHDAQELQRSMTAKAEKGNTTMLAILEYELDDINQRIVCHEKQIAESAEDVTAFINSVKNPRVCQLLRLRYQHGLAWCEVPQFVTGLSEAGCRNVCSRFLKKHCT